MCNKIILAGDIGGTKTYLGLFKMAEEEVRSITQVKEYTSKSYPSYTELLQDFLSSLRKDEKNIDVACFGIAGPIKTYRNGEHYGEQYCKMSSINKWPLIEENDLNKLIICKKVILINDIEAIGYGIPQLPEKDLVELNPGKPQKGNCAVIAAGTGLGEAKLDWDGNEHIPLASEGGRDEFTVPDEFDEELRNYLLKKRRPKLVNYHKVLSGSGLVNIYECLRDSHQYGEESACLKCIGKQDKAQAISEEALSSNGNSLCIKALDVFVSIYGARASNLASKSKAVNGLYIGGGIAPKILDKLRDGTFMDSFANKNGEFSDSDLRKIPVKVIMNPQVGLLGAAWHGTKTIEVNHK